MSWLIGILDGTSTAAADVYGAWVAVRAGVIAPVLQVAVWACMVMSVMLVVEAVYNSVVSLGVKAIGWRPEWRFKWKALDGADEEMGSAHFPMVLVQIPMYNELEVRTDHHEKDAKIVFRIEIFNYSSTDYLMNCSSSCCFVRLNIILMWCVFPCVVWALRCTSCR